VAAENIIALEFSYLPGCKRGMGKPITDACSAGNGEKGDIALLARLLQKLNRYWRI
jgi:hypothetical protein